MTYLQTATQLMTTRYRFGPADRVQIDGIDYTPISNDQHGHMLTPFGDERSLTISLSHAEVAERLRAGTLVVFQNWYDARSARTRLKSTTAFITDLPDDVQREVLRRLHFCQRFLEHEAMDPKNVSRSDASMHEVILKLQLEFLELQETRTGKQLRCGKKGDNIIGRPSPRSMRRWLRDYEASGFNPMSLRPGHHRSGNRTPRLDADSRAFSLEHAWRYASLHRPSKAMVHGLYEDAIAEENLVRHETGLAPLKGLGSRAFGTLISALPLFAVYAGRYGEEAARLKFAICNRGIETLRPLERVEMDEHQISLQALLVELGVWSNLSRKLKAEIERTRAWLTVAVDVATRCILALRLLAAPPNSESARAGLEMAIFDKGRLADTVGAGVGWEMHGLIESLATDGGAGFIANETQTAIRDLKIAYDTPPAGLPALRGTIERLFLTVQTRFVPLFPGATFENAVTRGNYDSEGNACLSLEDLNKLLIRFVVDIYHNSPHASLAGETPRNAWFRLTNLYGVEAPPPEHVRRRIFGIRVKRQITNRGIRFLGLHYQSPELQRLRQTVKAKPIGILADRHNLGRISVSDGKDWTEVPAVFQEIEGTSVHEWTAAMHNLRRHNADLAAMSKDIVRVAIRDLGQHADMARKRAEIGEPIISETAIDKFERELFLSFAFASEQPVSDEDLLGTDIEALPITRPQARSTPVPSDDEFGGPDDWRQE